MDRALRSARHRPNIYAMAALKRAYAERLGQASDLLADRFRLIAELHHLGAVMRMFDPAVDLAAILPIRPYRGYRERWSREALSILRQANGPMTPRAIARIVLQRRGRPLTVPNLQRVECSLHAVFERLEGRGLVRVGNAPKRWTIER
jgi:hypothetical protein